MVWHDAIDNLGPEARKTYQARIESGFFARYFSGEHILDVGYKGTNPNAIPIVPRAIGIDRDYPGYDGIRLPFPDASQDAVHSSHCLEHIADYRATLAEWFRVLKVGGHLILTVPHRWLYERKPTPTSRFGGNEHLRFYTTASLMAEVEEALPAGGYRVRVLRDNDDGFNYAVPSDVPPQGCYEIELVLQKISPPSYAADLVLSPRAKAIIAIYVALLQVLLGDTGAAEAIDLAAFAAFGRAFPIPPYAVIRNLFSTVPETRLRQLLSPMVDPTVVDPEWSPVVHPDIRADVESVKITDIGDHYQKHGYFASRLPRKVDPVYR
jgi:SAM-dependent methyltransferase